MAEDKAIKKAAQDSISRNNHTLSEALQSSSIIFQQVVEKCAAQKIISSGEKNTYLDTFTNQPLAHRAGQLVSNLQRTVGVVPNTLDDILCIFHESENLVVQEAAKTIAKDYQFSLPKYRGLTCSQQQPSPPPAVVQQPSPPPPAVAYTGTRPARQASQSTLTIRNLKDVLNDLRDGDFNDRSWHSLGVELGLRPRTLNNIKSDYSEAEECLRACISKWLSRTDDVNANGGANWSTLCDAIERIGETGAHFIRGQHGLIPSQPVEQINYQGHSEPSKIESSDDGGQLRQRSSAAPSNESSGTEGADKPPPPSNSSSSVTTTMIFLGVALLLFALFLVIFWK